MFRERVGELIVCMFALFTSIVFATGIYLGYMMWG